MSGGNEHITPPKKENTFDVGSEFSSESVEVIDETERLKFAKQILFCLALFCAVIFGAYVFLPENEPIKQIFELVKIGVFPLITLVIAFYFPNTK